MNRRRLLATAALLGIVPRPGRAEARALRPPVAAVRPLRREQLGRVRVDDYAWLRDPNWAQVSRDARLMQPAIREHLAAENRYAESVLAPTQARQDAYVRAQAAIAGEAVEDPPIQDGPWLYYRYVRPGEDHLVHARRPADGGPEQVLLDEEARAAGRSYHRVIEAAHSPDHTLFVWAEDTEGGDRHRICVHDLTTGKIEVSPSADGYGWSGLVVSPCSRWLFWTQRDAFGRPAKVFRRPARGGADALVHHEKDAALFVALGRTRSDAFVTVRIFGPDLDEWRLVPAGEPEAAPRVVEPRRPGLHYQVEHWDDGLVILTDADGAVDGRLMRTPPDRFDRAAWRDWLPHEPGRHLLEMHPFKDRFVRLQRRAGRLEIVVTPRAGGADSTLDFREAAYKAAVAPGQPYDSPALRVIFESPRTPKQWLDCDWTGVGRRLVRAQPTRPGFDAERYEVRRLDAPASDGERVPITVLMRKDAVLDGSSKLLLYGYGAYGISTEAEFSPAALALVDQGWIHAVAHVRGGSEKGRRWFLDGRRLRKRNSFTDFVACAEHLIAGRYTRRGRIVAYGLSAGGLLVAGAMNERPDLWAGVIAQVPFVDMLNTMSDPDHPLVPAFRPDWGDPLSDPEAYDYIASISPYENVARRPYPAVLATAGVMDGRVSYWEPGKWVARLRALTTSDAPILFKIDMAAGHQTASGLSDQFRQMALFWAFADFSVARTG